MSIIAGALSITFIFCISSYNRISFLLSIAAFILKGLSFFYLASSTGWNYTSYSTVNGSFITFGSAHYGKLGLTPYSLYSPRTSLFIYSNQASGEYVD